MSWAYKLALAATLGFLVSPIPFLLNQYTTGERASFNTYLIAALVGAVLGFGLGLIGYFQQSSPLA